MKSLLLVPALFLTTLVYSQEESKGFVEIFAQVEDRTLYVEGDKVAILDNDGKQLTPLLKLKGNYESVFGWDGFLYARREETFVLINEENKMGVFNVNGDMLMDFIYDYIRPIEVIEEYEIVDYLFTVKEGDHYVFKDTANQTMFQGFTFDTDGGKWSNSEIYVVIKDGKAKFVDLFTLQVYDKAPEYLRYDKSKIYSPTGTGVVDSEGNVIYPFIYDLMEYYSDLSPYFEIGKDGKMGVGYVTGEIIIPVEYHNHQYYCELGFGKEWNEFLIVQKEKDGPYQLMIKNEKTGRYEESDRYSFSEVKCLYDKESKKYNTLVTDMNGKQGILNSDANVTWK